jgi:hypothetical protein
MLSVFGASTAIQRRVNTRVAVSRALSVNEAIPAAPHCDSYPADTTAVRSLSLLSAKVNLLITGAARQ